MLQQSSRRLVKPSESDTIGCTRAIGRGQQKRKRGSHSLDGSDGDQNNKRRAAGGSQQRRTARLRAAFHLPSLLQRRVSCFRAWHARTNVPLWANRRRDAPVKKI